jgi:hypothetical protein
MTRIHRSFGLVLLVGGAFLATATTAIAHVHSRISAAQDTQPLAGAPTAPDGCQARLVQDFGGWRVYLTWNDRSSNEDGFILEWRFTGDGLNSNGTYVLPANATGTILFAGPSGTHARYRVKGFNSLGESRWSNWASLTVP